MTAQAGLWSLAGASLAIAVAAAFAEQRRNRRRNLDDPGWVPWAPIQVLAGTIAVIAAALALKA